MSSKALLKAKFIFILSLVFGGLASHRVSASEPSNQSQLPEVAGEKDSTTVTVTGKRNNNKIDRQVYETGKDPASQTGSVEDALKKVPGVDVDNDGNVTLRGKHVQVYLNGRPSLLLSGDNRGLALKAMPSKIINRIEVISNPGAQYSSEGSGGIINIVTQSSMPPGHLGNYALKLESTGGYTPSFFEMRSGEKLTLMGFLGFVRGETLSSSRQSVEHLNRRGQINAQSLGDNSNRGHFAGAIFFGNFEYKLGKDDTLGGQANLFHGNFASSLFGHTESRDASAAQTSEANLSGPVISGIDNESLNLNWTHYGRRPDETLKLNFDYNSSLNTPDSLINLDFIKSPLPDLIGTQQTQSVTRSLNRYKSLGLEYNVPIGDDQLAMGLEIRGDDTKYFTNSFGPGPIGSDLELNPMLSQFFMAEQITRAAYITYQKEIGDKWTFLGGLRSETVNLKTRQIFTNEVSTVNDSKLNPSFYATYILSPKEKLRFNYAQRLQRPAASDYNPRLAYTDSFNVYSGNSLLKPQITQGFELSYEYTKQNLIRTVRTFYKRDTQLISSQSRIIPDPQNLGNQVIETTRVNQGSGKQSGVEFYFSNQIAQSLKLEIDGVVEKSDINTAVWSHARSLTDWGGKIALNYTTKSKDQWQINFNRTAGILNPQGYSASYSATGFQYIHNLTPQVQLTVGGSDIFRTVKAENIILSPFVRNRSLTTQSAPVYFISLTRNFYSFSAP